jgi:N-acetyl-1-D-myo-inositol-2-amino-2-deoxy-alpha-D-glucopyranoside deacetylase
MPDVSRTLLLVHAHPDDEVLASGATMAHHACLGDRVVLVTCTRGELGEIVAADLAHLDQEALGEHRAGELATACRALGVSDQLFLGGAGRFRDSDMVGRPGNEDPRSFWQAELSEAANALVEVLDREQPDVVITYDANGGYGHPDHIKAHLTTHEAVRRATHQVRKVYEMALPTSFVQQGIDLLAAAGHPGAFFGLEKAEDLPFTVADEQVTTMVDGSAQLAAKRAALQAHRSQISPEDPLMLLTQLEGAGGFGMEFYTLVRGELGPRGEQGWETDLFA